MYILERNHRKAMGVCVSALNNDQSFSMQVRDAGSTSNDAWRKVWG